MSPSASGYSPSPPSSNSSDVIGIATDQAPVIIPVNFTLCEGQVALRCGQRLPLSFCRRPAGGIRGRPRRCGDRLGMERPRPRAGDSERPPEPRANSTRAPVLWCQCPETSVLPIRTDVLSGRRFEVSESVRLTARSPSEHPGRDTTWLRPAGRSAHRCPRSARHPRVVSSLVSGIGRTVRGEYAVSIGSTGGRRASGRGTVIACGWARPRSRPPAWPIAEHGGHYRPACRQPGLWYPVDHSTPYVHGISDSGDQTPTSGFGRLLPA